MTTAFFAPPENVQGDDLVLPDDEAHHAARVLRHRPGDEIEVVDGAGTAYRVRLEGVDRPRVWGRVIEKRPGSGEPDYDLTIAIAPLKNHTRFETFIEKAVELGVSRVVPIATARSERAALRVDRLQRIALAAMKQCGRSRLLQLDPLTPWDVHLVNGAADRLLCHLAADRRFGIADALERRTGFELIVAVGPEGGFTEDEARSAETAGWLQVGLGSRRLRTETAGLTAAAAVMLHFEARPTGGA